MEQQDTAAVTRYLRIRFRPAWGAPAFGNFPYLVGLTPAKRPRTEDALSRPPLSETSKFT